MSTVDKALRVLDLFSESQPNLGLSEIARMLGWDKSNVQRYVTNLTARGILEQDPRDKSYYLGPALTRLAMVRERTHPIEREMRKVLAELVSETGETAHVSSLVDGQLMTTAVEETKIRGTRVYVDPAQPLPFHASGSGIAFLSRAEASLADAILKGQLERFTPETPLDRAVVEDRVKDARENGFARIIGSFESDVAGVAAPLIGYDGYALGAVAVATPIARFSKTTEAIIIRNVKAAAARISVMHGAGGMKS